jgi:proline iminopeptidase
MTRPIAPLPSMLVTGALTQAQVGENGTTVDTPGAKIYHYVIGSGGSVPLVVVNGGPGFAHDYLHCSSAWSDLAKTRRVVFYDQRGTGRSRTQKDAAMDLASQIEDLETVRAHVGVERMDLLGHSWGGYLVMAYAARHPERVSRLVVVDSAAPKLSDTKILFDDVFPELMELRRRTNFAQAIGDRNAVAEDIQLYLSMLFYSTERRDQFLANAGRYHFAIDVNRSRKGDLMNYDLTPELGKFRMPALVVTGRYDMNVAPLVAWKIHRAIASARLVVFERSGHLPFFEEPEAFVKTVEEFLGH